jgi:hypothetical protein
MADEPYSVPRPRAWVIDTYFIAHRAKLLDVAAFLDRVDRAASVDPAAKDVRIAALEDAIRLLVDGDGERARRMLELFSDPTSEPLERAPGKGAIGVWPGYRSET